MTVSSHQLWTYDFSRLESALADVAAQFGPPPRETSPAFIPLRRASVPAVRTPFPRLSPELKWIALPPVLLSGFVLLHGLFPSADATEPPPAQSRLITVAGRPASLDPPTPPKAPARLIERSDAAPAQRSMERPILPHPIFASHPVMPSPRIGPIPPVAPAAAAGAVPPADGAPRGDAEPMRADPPRAEPNGAEPPSPRLFGLWSPQAGACGRRSPILPMVLGPAGAKAGTVACRFENKRLAGNSLSATALCAGSGERWRSNVQITLQQNRLTWRSERGSQTYHRCG